MRPIAFSLAVSLAKTGRQNGHECGCEYVNECKTLFLLCFVFYVLCLWLIVESCIITLIYIKFLYENILAMDDS